MRPFIYGKRNLIHIIDLRETVRSSMPFVSERWLGGTLTNYRTIRDRLKRLQELEQMWLPAGEKADKLDMNAYMKTMLNEAGKFDLSKAPETGSIRTYSKK